MSDTKLSTGGPFPADTQYVSRDESLRGSGTTKDPLGVALAVSAQIRVMAHTDADGNITYSSSVIRLQGSITYGGLETISDGSGVIYLKVILTLGSDIADRDKIPIPGIHFPFLPPGPVGETVFLYVPPIPLQTADNTEASMLMPIFGKGVLNTDEIVDVTYQLILVSL